MNIPFLRKSDASDLRDELIRKGTEAILWEQMYRSAVRRHREPRKDKASVIEAREITTLRLLSEVGRL